VPAGEGQEEEEEEEEEDGNNYDEDYGDHEYYAGEDEDEDEDEDEVTARRVTNVASIPPSPANGNGGARAAAVPARHAASSNIDMKTPPIKSILTRQSSMYAYLLSLLSRCLISTMQAKNRAPAPF